MRLGDESGARLELHSGLAEGADRLVARQALELGCALHAVLPMARALYERDFTTPASREQFATLLAAAERVVELPLANGVTREAVETSERARTEQYRGLGHHLAEESDVLIALWNGHDNHKPGGTADVVKRALARATPCAVYQIRTPRQSDAEPLPRPFETVRLAPD